MYISIRSYRNAISRAVAIGIIVVIVIAAAIGVLYVSTSSKTSTSSTTSTTQTPTSVTNTTTTSPSSTSITVTTTSSTGFTLSPKNSSILVDESQGQSPDSLDPQVAFFPNDESYLNAIFQDLVMFNGTNAFQYSPVEASSWTITNNSQEYIFQIRPDVYFSNGDKVTAYDFWFTYTRLLYMNAPSTVAPSNFNLLTENMQTDVFTTVCGNAEPWGLINAVSSVTGMALPTSSNAAPCKPLSNFLNNMLSRFDPKNSTQSAIMAYENQAYVAPNATTFIIRTMRPYGLLLGDIAGFSGSHTVDPAVVDSHPNSDGLAVENNTINSYLNAEGTIGTGPYVIKTVSGTPASEIVLVKNPDYWASTAAGTLKPGLPWFIAPAKIAEIDIKYAPPTTEVYNDFGTNVAQITAEQPGGSAGITEWGQLWSAYQYKNYFNFSSLVRTYGLSTGLYYFGMNSQSFPTNITAFRQAVYWSMNYTAFERTEVYYNNTAYGQVVLGPSIPAFGKFYDPQGLPVPSQNIPLAQKYIAEAGNEGHFYVVLQNGTELGDTSGNQLGTIQLVYESPLNPAVETQLDIYISSLEQIGVSAAAYGVTEAVYDTMIAVPSTAPILTASDLWAPDYPDPFLQMLVAFMTTCCGLTSYVNNATITNIVDSAAFNTNATQQMQADEQLYQISAQQAYYVWLPVQDNVLWVQPYVQGIYFNAYSGYFYNLMYYVPATSK